MKIGSRLALLGAVPAFWVLTNARLAQSSSGSVSNWIDPIINIASLFTTLFLKIYIEAVPFLLLGAFFSGTVEIFVGRLNLDNWFSKIKTLGPVIGSLLGLFLPVSECGVVPLGRQLFHKDIPVGVGVSFFLAAPVINPIVIASTYSVFGFGPIFWGRMLGTLTVASLTGWLFSIHPEWLKLLEKVEEFSISTRTGVERRNEITPIGFSKKFKKVILVTTDEFFEFNRWLVIGGAVAALVQVIIPKQTLLGIGQGSIQPIFALVALAAIISNGSPVDAFSAMPFIGVFTNAAIISFLITGPIIDIKNMVLFSHVFQRRTLTLLVVLPLGMIVLMGLLFTGLFH
jgi:uncharacterized membrane protein YraQ (UPF0718 family)